MTITYQPGVRIVLGYAGTAVSPPPTYASEATLALQEAVGGLGKDWKRVAPIFVIAPASDSGQVAIGLAVGKVPKVFDTARMLGPNTAIAKEHLIDQGGFARAPDVDRYGNVQAVDGILRALEAAAEDRRLAGLGLRLEATDQPPEYFLVSDDGRAGAHVFGQVLWKLGKEKEGGGVKTWSRDYGGGEGARLIGVPAAEVGPEAPLVKLDSSQAARSAHQQAATAAVKALLDTPAAFNWYLVC